MLTLHVPRNQGLPNRAVSRHRITPDPVRASALAGRLLSLGKWGVELRASDQCAGGFRVSEVECVDSEAPIARPEAGSLGRRLALRRETHGRGGHDSGCTALGLPIDLIDAAIERWDASGAGNLLREAMLEAIEDISMFSAPSGRWQPEVAREALGYSIERRITPDPPALRPQT